MIPSSKPNANTLAPKENSPLGPYPNLHTLHLWFDALTSGLYTQCFDQIALVNAHGTECYCGVGLLFHVTGYLHDQEIDHVRIAAEAGVAAADTITHRFLVRHLLNLHGFGASNLFPDITDLNDECKFTFAEIAAWLPTQELLFPLFQDLSLTCSCL